MATIVLLLLASPFSVASAGRLNFQHSGQPRDARRFFQNVRRVSRDAKRNPRKLGIFRNAEFSDTRPLIFWLVEHEKLANATEIEFTETKESIQVS